MSTKSDLPETLMEAINFFNAGDNAFDLLVARRWPKGVRCPQCDSTEVRFIRPRKLWECKHCTVRKQFSVKVGTIFEDSAVPLSKWLAAFWLISNAKNGISSYEIGRSLGVTQKTGWFMLQRIRLAMQNGSIMKMGGIVEADETFIGGKARNMHKAEKAKRNIKTGGMSMTPVMGLLERGTREQCSRVKVEVVKTRKRPELQANVRKYVLKGSEVHTDALRSYNGLCDEYTHNVIDHAVSYVNGHVHTNGMENFWSLLKRAIKGTYVSVEPFHLFRYLDEQAFRFNERKDENGDQGRFFTALSGIFGKRLTYKNLIGDDAAGLQTATAW